MCRNLFEMFEKAIKKNIDCPVEVVPKCHPRSHCEVFLDVKKLEMIIACSKCNKPISKIKVHLRNEYRPAKRHAK